MFLPDFLIEKINNLPPLNQLKRDLEYLAKLYKSNPEGQEIKDLINQKAHIIPFITATLNIEENSNKLFYRARILDESKEDNSLIKSFSYPPSIICKSNGRANLKNKSVFYCCLDPFTSILESKPVSDTFIYLSIWKMNLNFRLRFCSYLSTKINDKNVWFDDSTKISSLINSYSQNNTHSKSEEIKLIFQFWNDIFIIEKENYPITSWLSNEALYNLEDFSFIIYPSVASKTQSCNFAFHPNAADKYLNFEKVFKIFIKKVDDEFLFRSDILVGKIDESQIKYSKPDIIDLEIINQLF